MDHRSAGSDGDDQDGSVIQHDPAEIPLLRSVIEKTRDALVVRLMRAWGLDESCQKLGRYLATVHHILLDVNAKSRTDPAVRRWMADFKTAAYQADAVLDAFRYEALRRRDAQMRRHSTARKVLSHFTVNSPVALYVSMSRKTKDVLEIIDKLAREVISDFPRHVEVPSGIHHPETHSHVRELEIIDRQYEEEQVVKTLLDHSHNNSNNNNVMVLPIVGMGGIGKTILAELVQNDQRVMHHFELVLWVYVSDIFIIKEIVQSIIQVATGKQCAFTEMETLQKELSQVLDNRRYLLVLDDVWNEDTQKWHDMRSLLLCSCAGSGSAIIVTTRSSQVASIMGTLPPLQISLLDEEQSWQLFLRNLFGFGSQEEMQEEFISVAMSIVRKCKGLPVAIKAMADLLCSKPRSQWFSVLDNDAWKDGLTTTGIVHILWRSYDQLQPDEKLCFSFCAIFPKDRPMDKDMLIQLWMAHDFIASQTSLSLEQRGQQIFDVLVWRCFFQDVTIQKGLLTGLGDEFIHRPTTCKMHDLMHDLADVISGNDCYILQESSSSQEILQGSTYATSLRHKVRHLSLDYVSNNTIASMKEILAPQLRTVLVFQKKSGNEIPLSMAESKFMSFRALKTFSIHTNMTNLKHVRYLDLSDSDISALPEAIVTWRMLQTFESHWLSKPYEITRWHEIYEQPSACVPH